MATSWLEHSAELQPFYVREKEQIKVLNLDATKNGDAFDSQEPLLALPTPKSSLWNSDGRLLALADIVNGVQVVEFSKVGGAVEEIVHTVPNSSKTTQHLQWSPNSEVLVAISPFSKESTEPNVVVYKIDISGGKVEITELASFSYKKIEKDRKIFQWSPDSSLCARLCPDGNLVIVPGNDPDGEQLAELALAHAIINFEFAPVQPTPSKSRIAIFVGDVRDDMQRVTGPAEVTIWELSSSGTGDDLCVMQNRKAVASVSQGQNADLQWNSTASALLAHCTTEVDETGASYYGGSKLLLLCHDGSYQIDITEQDTGSSGTTVQAIEWNPVHDEFVLIRGFQPAQATLWSWDAKAKKATLAKTLLEKAHCNTIRFNHFGSLVCIAGFGNLAGDVTFFGRRGEKCDYGKVSSCQANCTVSAEWSPDGRHFLTAVLAPRMRVDNGICVWKGLTASKVSEAKFEELFDVKWKPDPPGKCRFSEILPDEIEQAIEDALKDAEAGAPKKQAYRPPKARGEGGGNVSAMMRGEMAPDPDDRRSRKPRTDALRPPVRRDEDPSPEDQQQDGRRGSRNDSKDREQPGNGQGQAQASPREPGWRPPPPEQAAPPPPKNANAAWSDPAIAYSQQNGYPQQYGAKAPGAAPQHAKAPGAAPQAKADHVPNHQPVQQAGAVPKAKAGQVQNYQALQQAAAAPPQRAKAAQQPAVNPNVQQPWQPKSQAERAAPQAQPDFGREGQAGGGHGQKLPCPTGNWQYVDPKQNIQGPFTLLEMQQWHSMGYFRTNLPMRFDNNDRFAPFGELFPHPMIPFQSYPKRPAQHAMNTR